MRQYRFYQLDVFTNRPFGGNPLAVFVDARGLTDNEMQSIAREMNLSETTFVLPPTDPKADVHLRIFTPARELPLAGHPVVGTHWLLAELGRYTLNAPVTRVMGQLSAGTLPVDISVEDGRVTRVTMTQVKPVFRASISPDQIGPLADALGLVPDELRVGTLLPQTVSTGVPQLMVPVKSIDAVGRIQAAGRRLAEVAHEVHAQLVYPFTFQTISRAAQVHARAFPIGMDVPEDAATGSAAGALGAYLVRHQAIPLAGSAVGFVIEQGLEMYRPSLLGVEVDGTPDAIQAVRVGGAAVTMIEGELRLPG